VSRGALTRGGLAALLVALGIYVLLGGGIDLGGGDSSSTGTQTTEVRTDADQVSAEEAREISGALALVEAGGPFPYAQDGATFSNREGRLPNQPSGYYREYTVQTPGSPDRGARRLVIGDGGETYYTRDHYDSFIQIDPADY
jgi:ribonuclease T1